MLFFYYYVRSYVYCLGEMIGWNVNNVFFLINEI